jgi:3-oxo-4-pregnene-20-carboxyl-CoA dehydrogenase beta subunit
MFLDLTDEQRGLRDDLQAYFATLISPAERAAMLTQRHGTVYRDVVRRMGRDGWLGVGWPVAWARSNSRSLSTRPRSPTCHSRP